MMKHPFVKKFLYIYIGAVILVLGYFAFKTLFTEEKAINLKSFNTSHKAIEKPIEVKEEKTTKFLLLPKKD